MNDLNSIVVEGEIVAMTDLLASPMHTEKSIRLHILSRQYTKKGTKLNYFTIRSQGKNAERIHDKAEKGRRVRIVGQLETEEYLTAQGEAIREAYIKADHVEFRPPVRTKEAVEA